uniref:Uncharacterized protein n=1 Tax=Magnetococcus massalia (strain MO-1) TaxID=451514 RepID=A0A1S7LF04_MAGMO|nr:protein of unknown function [Candidatus Magnetococcus massalia]
MRDEQRRRRAFEAKPEGPGTPNPFHTTPGAAMDEMSTEPSITNFWPQTRLISSLRTRPNHP